MTQTRSVNHTTLGGARPRRVSNDLTDFTSELLMTSTISTAPAKGSNIVGPVAICTNPATWHTAQWPDPPGPCEGAPLLPPGGRVPEQHPASTDAEPVPQFPPPSTRTTPRVWPGTNTPLQNTQPASTSHFVQPLRISGSITATAPSSTPRLPPRLTARSASVPRPVPSHAPPPQSPRPPAAPGHAPVPHSPSSPSDRPGRSSPAAPW